MAYSSIAQVRLYPPTDDDYQNDIEGAIKQLKACDSEGPIPDASGVGEVEELYYKDGQITLRAVFGDAGWFASLEIPCRPSKNFHEVLGNITDDFGGRGVGTGLFIGSSDLAEVMEVTPDKQGRVTVGRQYADEPLTIAIQPNDDHTITDLDTVTQLFHTLYGANPQAPITDLDINTLASEMASVYGAETVNTAIDALGWDPSEHGV